jgi:acetylglutamate kinase
MRLVIKFGGALLEDQETVQGLARQVAALAQQGHEILVVHGGGKIFTTVLGRMGIESRFVGGLRLTDRETRDVAVMVLGGLLNKRLAGAISAEGRPAVGIAAGDAACFRAEPLVHNEVPGGLGFVGYITGLNVAFFESLWRTGIVPVAACLGLGPDGELYNINADHMAAACAEYLHADHLIYLTDVAGVLDGGKILRAVNCDELGKLVETRVVSGGMLLKLEAAKRALEGGVADVRIIGGTTPDALFSAMGSSALPAQAGSRPRRRRASFKGTQVTFRQHDAKHREAVVTA